MNTKKITRIAFYAVIYSVLTIVFSPISYGPIQVRISEFLTLFPFLVLSCNSRAFFGMFYC